jgi:hypothetical protein
VAEVSRCRVCPPRITNAATAGAIGAVADVQKMIEDRSGSIHSAPKELALADELDVL